MADRVFERVLNQVSAQAQALEDDSDPARRYAKKQRTEEDALRGIKEGMTARDAIKRILLAYKDKDYFRCAVQSHLEP